MNGSLKSLAFALGGMVLSSSAFAATNLGTLSGTSTQIISFAPGSFDFVYNFTLANASSFAAIESDGSIGGFLTGSLTLLTSPAVSSPITTTGIGTLFGLSTYTQLASLTSILGAGTYTLELTGTSTGSGGGAVTLAAVSAVPEPATWAMMLIGFAGMGFYGSRKLRTQQGAALAA